MKIKNFVYSYFRIIQSNSGKVIKMITREFSYLKVIFTPLILIFVLTNIFGNIPLTRIFTQYYSITIICSLIFWLSLILRILKRNKNKFISHLTPEGTTEALIIFLPLIETISQILRPLTLAIRIRTNLASGHIILFIFSFFAIRINQGGSIIIRIILLLLIILEFFIIVLQGIIFNILILIYFRELN